MKPIARINGQEINDPINMQELEVEFNFEKERDTNQVSINDWQIGIGDRRNSNDGAVLCLKHIESGLTGGVGVAEGLPFSLDVEHGNKIYNLFEGILDLGAALVGCDEVIAPAIPKQSIDLVSEQAEKVTFERLFLVEKTFTSAEYVSVPYIISTIPDYQNTVIAALGLFVIGNEIKDQIQSLAEYVSAASNPFTANIIISVILRVLYITALLIAIVKFLKQLFNLLIQPVKYHNGMYVIRLCQIGSEYLGYKFKSSFLESAPLNKLLLIPQKQAQTVNDDQDGILGMLKPDKNEENGFYKGTFGSLLRALIVTFHAKVIVKDGYLMLERSDYTIPGNTYVLPPANPLGTYSPKHRFNIKELISNYVIEFQTDLNEKNTIQQYEGSIIQVQTSPIRVNETKNVLITSSKELAIPFALVKVKTDLTFPEKIFDAFYKAIGAILGELVKVVNKLIKLINKLIKAVNKIIKALDVIGIEIDFELKPLKPLQAPSFGNQITNRIGMMLLENDFINVPKLLLVNNNGNAENNKPLANNSSVLNALYLYDNFHFVESFVPRPGRPNANQYILPETRTVPFTFDDYEKVRLGNNLVTSDGEEGKIDSLKWNVYNQTAEISYSLNKLYTNNLKENKIIPDGK